MAQVVQYGSINLQSVLAPNVVVQILPPSQTAINGVPSNIVGVVGSATWGPVNSPTLIGSMTQQVQAFGAPVARAYDLGTPVYAATENFAANFVCVRVTDGTDVAADVDILDVTSPTPVTGIIATAKYTGSTGNSLSISVYAGSKTGSYNVSVALPNIQPEIFTNITGSGNTLWANMVAAINLGQSGIRGPSQLIVATLGSATGLPALETYTMSGGTDGATGVTPADMIGLDVSPRTGMYALRSQRCAMGMLADVTLDTTFSTQLEFGLSEGIEMVIVGPAGQTLAEAAAIRASEGVDSYDTKMLVGDWCYIFDTFNNVTRLISPQGFACGRMSNLAPNASPLNQPIYGVVGTETTNSGGSYTGADIVFACQNGLDLIYNPSPGGNYFALQTGQNSSSNTDTNTDDYTRLTNYLAYSIAAGTGSYIGQLQTPTVRANAKASLTNFFVNLFDMGYIGNVNYPNDASEAFSIILDATNNPNIRVSEGYMQADIQVVDYSVIRVFLVNLQNGQVSLNSVTPVA